MFVAATAKSNLRATPAARAPCSRRPALAPRRFPPTPAWLVHQPSPNARRRNARPRRVHRHPVGTFLSSLWSLSLLPSSRLPGPAGPSAVPMSESGVRPIELPQWIQDVNFNVPDALVSPNSLQSGISVVLVSSPVLSQPLICPSIASFISTPWKVPNNASTTATLRR